MASFVDRKPVVDGATVNALKIDVGDTFLDVVEILDRNPIAQVRNKDGTESIKYWVELEGVLQCISLSRIGSVLWQGDPSPESSLP